MERIVRKGEIMALFNVARGNKPASVNGLDANTLYFFTDTKEIYLGSQLYTGDFSELAGDVTALETWQETIDAWKNGTQGTQGAEARITALETAYDTYLDEIQNQDVLKDITASQVAAWDAAETNATAVANQKVASVSAADNSVTIGGTTTAPTVAVKLNAAADNAIQLTESGLKVSIPEGADYTVAMSTLGADTDYIQRYELKQGPVGSQTTIGTINIPKDMVVESGTVVTLTETDAAGHTAGTYIKLILANAVSDEIWIPVDSLIEYVTSGSTAGSMVMIDVDAQHRVTATITDGTITKAKLAQSVQDSLDLADSALQSIGNGDITKAMLEQTVQDSLDAADSALQEADITEGTANGSITVGSTSVSVHGLGSAAYTASTAYATAAQGALADTALQAADITTGSTAGTIAVEGTDVAVYGLGSAAYENAGAFATAAQGTNADNAITALTWIELNNSGD